MAEAQNSAELQIELLKQVKAALAETKQPLSPDHLAFIAQQAIKSVGHGVSSVNLKLYSELEDIARYIRQAKNDIASIKPQEISIEHIPRATDELDAVMVATEEATNKIMDVCDEVTAIAGGCPPETNEKLIACTTKIFEACNFQDITGQRITKVVETLKHIDAKVETLVKAMGNEIHQGEDKGEVTHLHADSEKGLLNGPQLPQNAANQDEIDRLLAEK